MFETIILASPRDLTALDLDQALDLLQDAGASTVSLEVIAPPSAYLRSAPDGSLAIVRDEGGFRFPTDGEAFRSLNLQPRGGGVGRAGLAPVATRCRDRGLGLRGRITATRLPQLATRYPQAAARNILGDVSPARICPAHLDVQHLLKATLADLSHRLGPSLIEIADLDVTAATEGADVIDVGCEPNPSVHWLLATCFCDACRQRAAGAGVDVSEVEGWFRERLTEAFNEPGSATASVSEWLAGAAEVRAYCDVQQAGLDAAATELAGLGVPVALVMVKPRAGSPTALGCVGTSSQVVLRGAADSAEAAVAWLRDGCGPDVRVILELPACTAHDAPQALVHRVKQAADARFSGVSIDHFGVLTPFALTAVRQGFRFARRQG